MNYYKFAKTYNDIFIIKQINHSIWLFLINFTKIKLEKESKFYKCTINIVKANKLKILNLESYRIWFICLITSVIVLNLETIFRDSQRTQKYI